MGKGSRNRTRDHKAYDACPLWKSRRNEMLDYPGHLALLQSHGMKLSPEEQKAVDEARAWYQKTPIKKGTQE